MNEENLKQLEQRFVFEAQKPSLIFDRFEGVIDAHPVIIFENHNGDLYYVKARGSHDHHGNLRTKHRTEIVIESYEVGLPYKQSYIDLGQIYRISIKDFCKYYDQNVDFYKNLKLLPQDLYEIYNNLRRFLHNIPPYISLSEIYFNPKENRLASKVLYCHKDLLEQELTHNTQYRARKSYILDILENRNNDQNVLTEIENLYLAIKSLKKELIQRLLQQNE